MQLPLAVVSANLFLPNQGNARKLLSLLFRLGRCPLSSPYLALREPVTTTKAARNRTEQSTLCPPMPS